MDGVEVSVWLACLGGFLGGVVVGIMIGGVVVVREWEKAQKEKENPKVPSNDTHAQIMALIEEDTRLTLEYNIRAMKKLLGETDQDEENESLS